MAGRGMGIATQGGGAVSSGSKNKMQSTPSKSTGIPMLANGGEINQHKRMAMGEKVMAKGGMAEKMMSHGGAAKKMKHGGTAKKMNYGGMAGKMMNHGGMTKKRTMRKGGCA